jgi:hypothetical protein
MPDITRDSDAILADARKSLAVQREGGFHRRKGTLSIGKGSAEIKARHAANKVARIVAATAAILVSAMVVGLVIDGIGFGGLPRLKVPKREDLNRGDVRQLVGRTELWLENQRPALPPPAVTLVDQIGVQLDALGVQLQHVDPAHPASGEIRQLVGETLPEMVDAYRRIPPHLRREANAGKTPDDQIVESLGKISTEIDGVTRQLASGALDDLAIKSRYLDYKYGDPEQIGTTVKPEAS